MALIRALQSTYCEHALHVPILGAVNMLSKRLEVTG